MIYDFLWVIAIASGVFVALVTAAGVVPDRFDRVTAVVPGLEKWAERFKKQAQKPSALFKELFFLAVFVFVAVIVSGWIALGVVALWILDIPWSADSYFETWLGRLKIAKETVPWRAHPVVIWLEEHKTPFLPLEWLFAVYVVVSVVILGALASLLGWWIVTAVGTLSFAYVLLRVTRDHDPFLNEKTAAFVQRHS